MNLLFIPGHIVLVEQVIFHKLFINRNTALILLT